MSERHITTRSSDSRRAGQTDWERLDRMTDAEAEANAASDADNGLWSDEQLAGAELVMPGDKAKVPISIRLDAEVVAYFKKKGPRYQTRINAVLQAYVRSMKAAGSR